MYLVGVEIHRSGNQFYITQSDDWGIPRRRIKNEGLPAVVIAHIDIATDGQTIYDFMPRLRSVPGGENVRVIFASQEFYGEGVYQAALELGADAGWDPTASSDTIPDWVIDTIKLDFLTPEEIPLRGEKMILSKETLNERLEFLKGASGSPERK